MNSFSKWLRMLKPSGRTNPAELFLLSTFLIPRTAEELPVMSRDDWKRSLGEDPLLFTQRLVKKGLIRRADLATHLDKNFTADQLRGMLREHRLSVPAHKNAMILYLIQAREKEMWKAVSNLEILVCTDQGVALSKQYLADIKNRKTNLVGSDHSALQNRFASILKWIAVAAAGGVIGNRVDNAVLGLIKEVDGLLDRLNNREAQQTVTTGNPVSTPFNTHTPGTTMELAPADTAETDASPDQITTDTPAPKKDSQAPHVSDRSRHLDSEDVPAEDDGEDQSKPDKARPESKLDQDIFLVPISTDIADEILRHDSHDEPSLDELLESAANETESWNIHLAPDALPDDESIDDEADTDSDGDDDLEMDSDSPPDRDLE